MHHMRVHILYVSYLWVYIVDTVYAAPVNSGHQERQGAFEEASYWGEEFIQEEGRNAPVTEDNRTYSWQKIVTRWTRETFLQCVLIIHNFFHRIFINKILTWLCVSRFGIFKLHLQESKGITREGGDLQHLKYFSPWVSFEIKMTGGTPEVRSVKINLIDFWHLKFDLVYFWHLTFDLIDFWHLTFDIQHNGP